MSPLELLAYVGIAALAGIVLLVFIAVLVGIFRPEQAAKMDGHFDKCPRCGYQAGHDVGSFRKPS